MIILWFWKLGITMLILNKDDIEFVTDFPCFFGTTCILKKKEFKSLTKKGMVGRNIGEF